MLLLAFLLFSFLLHLFAFLMRYFGKICRIRVFYFGKKILYSGTAIKTHVSLFEVINAVDIVNNLCVVARDIKIVVVARINALGSLARAADTTNSCGWLNGSSWSCFLDCAA